MRQFWIDLLKKLIELLDDRPNDNSIMMIRPYWFNETWVFDQPNVNLIKEPFVSGIPSIINSLVEDACIENPKDGFNLYFSKNKFSGFIIELTLIQEEYGGAHYYCDKYKKSGWLCPALYKFFKETPEVIYIGATN